MQDFRKEYAAKLKTAEEAVKVVKTGDWVDFGWSIGVPYDLDIAIAKRIKEEDLYDINFRGGVVLRELEIFKMEDAAKHISWNSWHMTGVERESPRAFHSMRL